MIRKAKEVLDVKICDECPEPKQEWALSTTMPNCHICGKDLCPKHAYFFGKLVLCETHNAEIWKFIKEKKKQFHSPDTD